MTSKARRRDEFKIGTVITVNDKMQQNYTYTLTAPMGDTSDYPTFKPYLIPEEILMLGAFEGKYCNDCTGEFPAEWFENSVTTRSLTANPKVNYFGIKSRSSLGEWRKKGWIRLPNDPDVRGWFQWYCRFWLGRRDPTTDTYQVGRWVSFKRHFAQVVLNCIPPRVVDGVEMKADVNDPSTHGTIDNPGNLNCRPKQRQALLQWGWNCFA